MKKSVLNLCLLLICIIITGCSNKGGSPKDKEETKKDHQDTVDEKKESFEGKFSVWTTYWDTKTIDNEIGSLQEYIDSICYFAAYFKEDKGPFIPEKVTDTYGSIQTDFKSLAFKSYLTFVNDLLLEDGSSSLKDTELLYTLLSSEEVRSNHINEILQMTMQGGFDGIEIDYEGMKKDIALWNLYVQFVNELYQAAVGEDILVRIILEPGIPVEEHFDFPDGPEYVMMCYNLYGYGTKPGPKADKEFLLEMVNKMEKLPGKVNFAVATGGFDFAKDGKVVQVTGQEAVQLIEEYSTTPIRDEKSKSMVFSYIDDRGISHEVWFADKETIQYWFDVIKEAGDYELSLWRIGGNIFE
ncbi:glycosyl hydrolase family 18 protein [Anaerocolumna sp.]|uniref:glycosyl hydrolase family 18 protein n=1 Tax=Anaerocolumna sp. TaxID=2041569 RepID=UPI0028AAC93E|nr:glycosyl hydrolase family 18 protein [Anaerocolumna sp.]